jgi:hypothetical protein
VRHFGTAVLAVLAATSPVVAQGFCPPVGFVRPLPFAHPAIHPWGWGNPLWPPVVVVPQPVIVAAPVPGFAVPRWDLELLDFRTPEDPRLAGARVDSAVRHGDLLVVEPKGNGIKLAGGLRPAPKPEPAVKPKLDPPFDPVQRAKEAFAKGELGLATERLHAFIAAQPNAPLPHFLLVQVRTARGEYAEAVAALRDGLRLDPNWPKSPFRIADFYGANLDRLRTDLAELEVVLAGKPDDPSLLFLSGYHLWFHGDRTEATRRFKRAAAVVKDAEPIERFLSAGK